MIIKQPRRRLRLPQLNKANRLKRRGMPVSEFVIMCDRIALDEQRRREERDLRFSARVA